MTERVDANVVCCTVWVYESMGIEVGVSWTSTHFDSCTISLHQSKYVRMVWLLVEHS